FLLFPSLMALLPARPRTNRRHGIDITPALGRFTERHGQGILVAAVLLAVFSIAGVRQLRVENSFIEYFDESTDIYQGMVTIDSRLGGTTPLDVIVDLAAPNPFADAGGFGEDPFADEEDFGWEEEEAEAG